MSETPPKPRVPGRDAPAPLPKRFYKDVGLGATLGGFAILLDGRPVKTPSKNGLLLPREALADRVAAEWASQGAHIDPKAMPLTKLCNTAIDRVQGREDEIAQEIAGYAGSDLVCYRAAQPRTLVAAQAAAWDPILAWARERLGAAFQPVTGLVHVAQPAQSLARVRSALDAHDAFAMCALHNITTLTGSALLALAHADGRLDLDSAWAAAHVDEDYQVAAWGADEEAAARRAFRWREVRAAGDLLRLARG